PRALWSTSAVSCAVAAADTASRPPASGSDRAPRWWFTLTDEPSGIRVEAPMWLAESAARFAEAGAEPAVPRLAATVILLRPTSPGYEVYAIRRASTMAFAPNMYAFPGGSVDPSDSDAFIGWAGPQPEDWATRLALPVGDAQAVVCAAVRELFEE